MEVIKSSVSPNYVYKVPIEYLYCDMIRLNNLGSLDKDIYSDGILISTDSKLRGFFHHK